MSREDVSVLSVGFNSLVTLLRISRSSDVTRRINQCAGAMSACSTEGGGVRQEPLIGT